MSISELLAVMALLAVIAYWLNAMRAKELARAAGRERCQSLNLIFLDDTVVLQKVRLARNSMGRMVLRRHYQFEFSSDGGQRYHGVISLMASNLDEITMDAYRIPE